MHAESRTHVVARHTCEKMLTKFSRSSPSSLPSTRRPVRPAGRTAVTHAQGARSSGGGRATLVALLPQTRPPTGLLRLVKQPANAAHRHGEPSRGQPAGRTPRAPSQEAELWHRDGPIHGDAARILCTRRGRGSAASGLEAAPAGPGRAPPCPAGPSSASGRSCSSHGSA